MCFLAGAWEETAPMDCGCLRLSSPLSEFCNYADPEKLYNMTPAPVIYQ